MNDCNHTATTSTSHALRQVLKRSLVVGGTLVVLSGGITLSQDDGPNSSLFSGRRGASSIASAPANAPLNSAVPRTSNAPYPGTGWYENPLPPPKEVRVNDIITIRVDLGQRVASEGEVQRRKTGRWDALLNDWVILSGLKAIKPAPQSDGDQRIQGNTNQLYRATGELETTESLKFEVGTTVQAILPNGNIVLEAHRKVRNNNELWLVSLSGICRREDIQPGNYVLSKDIANLSIDKKEQGAIRDSYRRGFVTRFLDTFSPF